MARCKDGFTLLETSIVLAIVGLIIGGILVGKSLMNQAVLRGFMQDIAAQQAAFTTFKGKYHAYPGDFRHATQYWGRADAGTPTTSNCAAPETDIDVTNPKATCNGDGDGMIANGSNTEANTETFRYWQHLSNAGLIPGSYTGVGGPVGGTFWRIGTIGVNVPPNKFKNGGFYVTYSGLAWGCAAPGWTGPGTTDLSNSLKAGGQTPQTAGSGGLPWQGLASGDEMYALDSKYDDGLPGQGFFMSQCPDSICTTTNDTSTAAYVGGETRTCRPQIAMGR